MQIYWKKESIYIRKEFNSHRIGLAHQHGRRFIVLGHQYGRRDVMWKHSITLKPPLFGLNVWLLASNCEEQFPIPTVGQLSGDRWPTFGRQVVVSSSSSYWTSESNSLRNLFSSLDSRQSQSRYKLLFRENALIQIHRNWWLLPSCTFPYKISQSQFDKGSQHFSLVIIYLFLKPFSLGYILILSGVICCSSLLRLEGCH